MINIKLLIGRDNVIAKLIRRELERNGFNVGFIGVGKDDIYIEDYKEKDAEEIISIIKKALK